MSSRKIPVDALERLLVAGKTLPSLVAVVGAESLLRDRAIDLLIRHCLDPGLADFNLDRFSGDSLEPEAVAGAAATLPMMAERRMVLVRRFEQLHHARRKRVIDGLVDLPSTTMVVLESATLSPAESRRINSMAFVVEAEKPREQDVLGAIAREVDRLGLKIDPRAAERLLAARGTDLTGIVSELEKLATYLGERTRIELVDVEEVVPSARQVTIFDLVDSLAGANLDASLRRLDRLYGQGEDPLAVVAVATRHFLILWRASLLADRGRDRRSAASALKVPPFFVSRYLRQAQHFDSRRIIRVLRELLAADLALKSEGGGTASRRSRGRLMIIRICATGGARARRT